ncbi:MAG: zinc ABC transporter substrate-binding protein [Bacteroidales bacterium]|jgi:zinc transport system substrate-binding protein|nr:zinc ABC transporter substrate-binding protein [Bacteroidales bacterium]
MTKFKTIILSSLLMLLFSGCVSQSGDSRPVIAVTILPQQYFTGKIAGRGYAITVLVPPGASAETYTPSPSQMRSMAKASVWLRIGQVDFETGWADKIRQNCPALKIFDTSAQADWLHGSHEHGSVDPHIWMAPDEVKKIAVETCRALSETFPADKTLFEHNLAAFQVEIDLLDRQLQSIISKTVKHSFLIFHPALGYFARRYGLEQIPMELDGKEPSPRRLRELIDMARDSALHTVFIQKEFDVKNARQLADEIGGRVEIIDPLAEKWNEQLIIIANKIAGQ